MRFGGEVPGKRKKCKKGKSCGAACISGSMVCMVDIPWVSAPLAKVAREIQNRKKAPKASGVKPPAAKPQGTPKAKEEPIQPPKQKAESKANKPLMEYAKELRSLYRDIKIIKESGLPSGEQDWRISALRAKIDELRTAHGLKVIANPNLEQSGRDTKAMVKLEDKLKLGSLTRKELEGKAVGAVVALAYAHLKPDFKDPVSREEREKEAVAYVKALPKGNGKDRLQHQLDLVSGKERALSIGSLRETQAEGKKIMDSHRERLNSAVSILRKRDILIKELEQRIKDTRGDRSLGLREAVQMRASLRTILQRVNNRGDDAELRALRAMNQIREEMLKTNLSKGDVERILGRIKFYDGGFKVNGPEAAAIKDHIREFARMFNGKGLMEVANDGFYGGVLHSITLSPDRAYARLAHMQLGSNGVGKYVTFHELGHIVESSRDWLSAHTAKWRDDKAYTAAQVRKTKPGDETREMLSRPTGRLISKATIHTAESGKEIPLYKLRDMPTNQNRGYKEDEVVAVDRFITPYMGKVYNSGSTEVLSIGIEKFSDMDSMLSLYKKHPDLFEFIVGMSQT